MSEFGLSLNPTQVSPWIYLLTAGALVKPIMLYEYWDKKETPTPIDIGYAVYYGVTRGAVVHRYGISWTTAGYTVLLSVQ